MSLISAASRPLPLPTASTSGVARGWRGKWWLVIVRDDALIVRLRSRLNADLPSEWANVLVIEREHVRSIAARRASLRLPDEDLGPSAPRTWLELELDADAPPAIARAIDREASPGIRGRTHFHAPIASLAAPARLRVHFGGGSAAMRPGLRTTLRALSKARYPVDDHVQCETHDWRAMGADERDAMIDALLARGERIQAVKLWRDAHGGGLAEALDALRAREQRRSA